MRVFDFDGTIYDGESLFDLYLFSVKYNPKVLRYIAPVLRYAIKYKPKRFRELYGDNVRVDEFYTDSRFDQPIRPAHDRHGPTCLHGQRQQNPPSQIAGKAGTEYGGKGRS